MSGTRLGPRTWLSGIDVTSVCSSSGAVQAPQAHIKALTAHVLRHAQAEVGMANTGAHSCKSLLMYLTRPLESK